MNELIPLIPEPTLEEQQAVIWKPTKIAEISNFYKAYCRNCVAHIDYELVPCDAPHEIALGRSESYDMIKVTSSGEPKCECFDEYIG